MKHLIWASVFCLVATVSQGQFTSELLIPPADPDLSGMNDARKQFLFLHKPGSTGFCQFVALMEKTWQERPEIFQNKLWAYDMALVTFKGSQKDGVNLLSPSGDLGSQLCAASMRYPFLADVSSPAYAQFYSFLKESSVPYEAIEPAVEAFQRSLVVQTFQRPQAPTAPQHSTTLDHGPSYADQEADREANRQASNSAMARKAAERKAQIAREREAAAGRSSQTVIIYNPRR